MAFIDIKFRLMPKTGGGRVMFWLVRPRREPARWSEGPFQDDVDDGWEGVKKLYDLRMWPDDGPWAGGVGLRDLL